jgi:hypothetical protein
MNSLTNDQALIVSALQDQPELNTYDLRRLGVPTPNTVVFGLRQLGYLINTQRKRALDEKGRIKVAAHYTLLGEPNEQL